MSSHLTSCLIGAEFWLRTPPFAMKSPMIVLASMVTMILWSTLPPISFVLDRIGKMVAKFLQWSNKIITMVTKRWNLSTFGTKCSRQDTSPQWLHLLLKISNGNSATEMRGQQGSGQKHHVGLKCWAGGHGWDWVIAGGMAVRLST